MAAPPLLCMNISYISNFSSELPVLFFFFRLEGNVYRNDRTSGLVRSFELLCVLFPMLLFLSLFTAALDYYFDVSSIEDLFCLLYLVLLPMSTSFLGEDISSLTSSNSVIFLPACFGLQN